MPQFRSFLFKSNHFHSRSSSFTSATSSVFRSHFAPFSPPSDLLDRPVSNGFSYFRRLLQYSSASRSDDVLCRGFSIPKSLSKIMGSGNFRSFSTEPDRESIEYDVVIVGAGPAGLSAAIRFKQMCRELDVDLSVCVVEKGAEVGAHILSGNVFEPRALNELLPRWKQEEAPIGIPVTSDQFWFLTKDRALSLPCPFNNEGNYVISLSQLVRWMGVKAEELGVEIYPGFAASEILFDANNKVIGIGTNDMGISKDGSKKENFQRGVEIKGRITLLAEGCRGSLSEKIVKKYNLREKSSAQHQTYALGIKEVWEIDADKHQPGAVLHTLGWPLDHKTYGGSFLYHMNDRQISIGLVVALNYQNPYMNPYEEFQISSFSFILPLLPRSTASALNSSLTPSSHSRALNTMDPVELKRVFQMFDRNGDGRITQKELNDSLESLGIFIPHKDLSQMIDKIDVNGDGCVDMDEFRELYKAIMEERNEEEDMREAFGVFDQNSDGFITVDELRSVLSSLGLKQGRASEDCRKMIMKVDVDGDGRVNYSEFKQMMKGGGFGALG
ncbi:hypothetical protein K1719_036266 [Acacia pycnantha]|nr:hypothetical protein K1719_036266 [Acacia pycnantha]